jgi:hypothetical protein
MLPLLSPFMAFLIHYQLTLRSSEAIPYSSGFQPGVPVHRGSRKHLTGYVKLKLVVCILLRVLGQVQGFRLMQHGFNILFSNRYMFRSYDHLQAEIYTVS